MRRRRDEVAVLDGVRLQPGGNQPRKVSHVAEEQGADLVGDLAEAPGLDRARFCIPAQPVRSCSQRISRGRHGAARGALRTVRGGADRNNEEFHRIVIEAARQPAAGGRDARGDRDPARVPQRVLARRPPARVVADLPSRARRRVARLRAERAEAVMRMHILGAKDALLEVTWRRALADGPLTGLRAIEFGQLLAGPYVGTLLGDFGADVDQGRGARARGDPMRDWGRLRHNDHSLWWSVLARNKRSVDAQPARAARARRSPAELCASADVVLENFRPGHDGEAGGSAPSDVHAGNPRRDLRARVRLRPDRPLPRPPGLRVRRRGDRRPALHQRLPRPGAAAHRASRSATRSPRSRRSRASCSRSTPATPAARRARSSTPRSPTPASR